MVHKIYISPMRVALMLLFIVTVLRGLALGIYMSVPDILNGRMKDFFVDVDRITLQNAIIVGICYPALSCVMQMYNAIFYKSEISLKLYVHSVVTKKLMTSSVLGLMIIYLITYIGSFSSITDVMQSIYITTEEEAKKYIWGLMMPFIYGSCLMISSVAVHAILLKAFHFCFIETINRYKKADRIPSNSLQTSSGKQVHKKNRSGSVSRSRKRNWRRK